MCLSCYHIVGHLVGVGQLGDIVLITTWTTKIVDATCCLKTSRDVFQISGVFN